MASDLLDNLLYYAGHLWLGKQLDELGPFNRSFRPMAGRRNVYAWMRLFVFQAGLPTYAFTVALAWALVTVGIHSVRLAYHMRRRMAVA